MPRSNAKQTELRHGRVLDTRDKLLVLIKPGGRIVVCPLAIELSDITVGDLVTATIENGNVIAVERVTVPREQPFSREGECGVDPRVRLQMLAVRARVLSAVRACFDSAGFLEVDTPQRVRSPGLDTHLAAFSVARAQGSHAGYLITSPEYHMKRLLVAGLGRCYQLGHCFRDEEHGPWHEPEFTMLEWYQPWESLDDLFAMTERVVCAVAECVHGADSPPKLSRGGHAVLAEPPFARITVRDAFRLFAPDAGDPVLLAERDEAAFHHTMLTKIEPHLGFDRPVFLTHYPAVMASLARRCSDAPELCERFELYAVGTELCNGFDELTDPVEQRARFEADTQTRARDGLVQPPVDERFLSALAQGMPPSVGNALGFDRLLALALGASRLEDVLAFGASRR